MTEDDRPDGLGVTDAVYEEDGGPRTVLWSGRQWAVTAEGLEGVIYWHRESVPADDLGHLLDYDSPEPELDNVFRIAGKSWVDVDEFLVAYQEALRLHRGKYIEPPAGSFARSARSARLEAVDLV